MAGKVRAVTFINGIFDSYYTILVIVLALMVPVWFGTFVFEAVATIVQRWRR